MFDPSSPPPADLALLHSLPHPACLHDGAYDVVETNSAFSELFPGTGPGANLLTAIMLEPMSRLRLSDWESEAQLMVSAFRDLPEGLIRPERREEIITLCRRTPEWDRMWRNMTDVGQAAERTMLMRNPESDSDRRMHVQTFQFSFPRRPWALLSVMPIE
ncbi:MmyB family transcriptional regulator [Nocardia sp. NPDC055321]